MALAALPMPKQNPCEEGYEWDALRIGNTQSCTAQGFFYVFGSVTMYQYNAMLCVYYACAIAFQMKEHKIRRKVEPFLHLIAIGYGLGLGITPIFYELYNGTEFESWCSIYVLECSNGTSVRGSQYHSDFLILWAGITVISLLLIMIVSFALVIRRAWFIEKELSRLFRTSTLRDDAAKSHLNSLNQNTYILLKQAMAYFIAFLITVASIPLYAVFDTGSSTWLEVWHLTFYPLQGFFNFVIFVCHKVYNYHRVHQDVSYCTILHILFCQGAEETIPFSRISIIQFNNNNNGNNRNPRDVDIEINDDHDDCETLSLEILNNSDPYDHEQRVTGGSEMLFSYASRSNGVESGGNDVMIDNDSRFDCDLSGFSESKGVQSTSSGLSFVPSRSSK